MEYKLSFLNRNIFFMTITINNFFANKDENGGIIITGSLSIDNFNIVNYKIVLDNGYLIVSEISEIKPFSNVAIVVYERDIFYNGSFPHLKGNEFSIVKDVL